MFYSPWPLLKRPIFKKNAAPADMASTAGVSFTLNHIEAVVLPALMGLLWLVSPAWVFIVGAVMAAISLVLARWVPSNPAYGEEWLNPFRPMANK